MKKVYYAVYDRKAEIYSTPFLEVTDGTAIRALQEAVRQGEHQFAKHPSDYSLHRLGTFEDTTAEIVVEEKKKIIEVETLGDK
jgi:hypothetical protein